MKNNYKTSFKLLIEPNKKSRFKRDFYYVVCIASLLMNYRDRLKGYYLSQNWAPLAVYAVFVL